jgi:hypothetical protein
MNMTQPQATADEDAKLRALLAADTSVALVAAKLKRTVGAVTARCSAFGLSLARRRPGT